MAKTFTKLTRPLMRKLKQGEAINEHGITFERLANNDGVLTVNIMVDGQRIHRVIGRETDGTTRTQAEEFIEKARQDAKTGRLNLPTGRKIALSFGDAAEKYLNRLKEEDGKDLVMKRRRLHLHLMPFFGTAPLSKISGFDIDATRNFDLSNPHSAAKPKTVRRYMSDKPSLALSTANWLRSRTYSTKLLSGNG